MKSKLFTALAICFLGLFVLSGTVSASQASRPLNLDPKEIDVNAFFSGKKLTISGQIAASEDVIIEITGKDTESAFDLKGRFGPFWMTKGSVTLEHVPELYLLLTPQGQALEKEIQDLGLGMNHLEKRISATGTVKVPDNIFQLFSALKEKEDLYRSVKGAVTYSDGKDGTRQFFADCQLPALIGTGSFQVIATTLENGAIKRQMKDSFQVKQVGFVKLVDHLASDARIAYGVTAVAIALFAGIVMGLVFRQDGGAH